jgi:uncharacterized membrane protein
VRKESVAGALTVPRLTIGRILFAAIFLVSGALHFLRPEPYIRIVPPYLPWHAALVAISGAAELAGGFGLFLPRVNRAAAYGLVILLVAVFPANIYMATAHLQFPGLLGEAWFQWIRLPLQFALIAWGWRYTRPARTIS